tara:strand:- start:229 stop:438 length:210 start_codon:yes stop_codon:yes gene_type:complete
MNKDEQNKTINMTLGKDVLNILIEAEIAMAKELGFNPTHSQAIKFLVKMYKESNISFKFDVGLIRGKSS